MVRLSPCVIKSLSFGEVTAEFLDHNSLYVTRMEGLKRDVRSHYVLELQNLKTFRSVALPVVPVRPKPTIQKAMFEFFLWLVLEQTDEQFQVEFHREWWYKTQDELSYADFLYLRGYQKLQLATSTEELAKDMYDTLYAQQDAEITRNFKPMPHINHELSSLAAALFTYRGEGKKLTQGLKALGLDVKLEQNYVTDGITGDFDLEELILSLSTETREPRK